MSSYNTTPLFGGAMTALIPSTFTDVSDIRQVPDNQEVYLDSTGFSSIIVEILERVEKPDLEALEFHLQDLVDEDAGETRVWRQADAIGMKLPRRTPVYTLVATSPPGEKQRGRANEPDFVAVLLTLVRLVEQKTDMIVAINVPHVADQYEPGSVDLEHGKEGKLLETAMEWRGKVLETLEILDWGLFVL